MRRRQRIQDLIEEDNQIRHGHQTSLGRSELDKVTKHPQIANLTSPQDILRLQKTIGNRGVQRLLANSSPIIQRDAEDDVRRPARRHSQSAEHLQQLQEDFEMKVARVPVFEVIAAGTGVDYSRGEFEDEIAESWTRERLTFTQAARHAARTNAGDVNSTQSPQLLASQPYAKRWGLSLYAYEYNDNDNLPELKEKSLPKSPLQQSMQAEFDHTISITNPTAQVIRQQIMEAALGVWSNTNEGEPAELVVFFSGHGSRGSIYGVDWEEVEGARLSGLAQTAQEDLGVHIVFVLDTCTAGPLARKAQFLAAQEISGRINASTENDQNQNNQDHAMAQQEAELVSKLVYLAGYVAWNAYDVMIGSEGTPSGVKDKSGDYEWLIEQFNQLERYVGELNNFLSSTLLATSITLPDTSRIAKRIRQLYIALTDIHINATTTEERERALDALHEIVPEFSPMLDDINDIINTGLENLDMLASRLGT